MKSHSWKYLELKQTTPLLALNCLQQILIALGTLALIKAGYNIQDSDTFITWIGIALLTHLASPLLAYFIRPLEVALTFKGYRHYLSEKLFRNVAQPSLWTLKDKKETYLASIGAEADSYLAAIIFVALDIFSYVLSLVLGVLVLGLTVDIAFVPAFITAGVLSLVIYSLLQNKVKDKSHDEQDARTHLGGYLLHSWENVFFNNQEIIKKYLHSFDINFNQTKEKALTSTRWSEGFVGILSTASSLPVIVVILMILFKEQQNTAALAALLVTIPRQLNLLGTFRSLFQSATSLISFEAKFQTLSENATLEKNVDLSSRIGLHDISVSGIQQDIYSEVQNLEQGRLTVRGANGAGKSTLLLSLNDKLENSFYMPAHPQFLIEGKAVQQSTGQAFRSHLEQIRNSEAQYILLDEWDANLDDQNLGYLNQLIEEISKSKVVIEVRHR